MGEDVGDALRTDPIVQRALAVVLLREALPLLYALDEHGAAAHLQTAIDTVLGAGHEAPPQGSC